MTRRLNGFWQSCPTPRSRAPAGRPAVRPTTIDSPACRSPRGRTAGSCSSATLAAARKQSCTAMWSERYRICMPTKTIRRMPNGQPQIVATYDYRDERGELLFQVVRYDPKDFRQRRPKPGGGWVWSVKGVRVVPYRLPELLARPDEPVFVVEGEKDVDNLGRIGVLATCNAGAPESGPPNTLHSWPDGMSTRLGTTTTRAFATSSRSLIPCMAMPNRCGSWTCLACRPRAM